MSLEDSSELFKQAVTSTMRAISGNEELTVTFGRGKPYLQGNRARVPLPEVDLSVSKLAALRGISDTFALRTRFHNETIHGSNRPNAGTAQEVYDSIEEARIACVGDYLMKGVGDNLHENLTEHCLTKNYSDIKLAFLQNF